MASTGSPKKRMTSSFNVFPDDEASLQVGIQPRLKHSTSAMPLTTSKLANRLNGVSPKKDESEVDGALGGLQKSPAQKLEARVNDFPACRAHVKENINIEDDSSSSATDPYAGSRPDAAEVMRLKKELALAQERMAQMDLQLQSRAQSQAELDFIDQSRITQHTVEQAIGSPFPAAQHLAFSLGVPGSSGPPMPFAGGMYHGEVGRPRSRPSGYTPPMTPLGFPQAPSHAGYTQPAFHSRFSGPTRSRSRQSPAPAEFQPWGQLATHSQQQGFGSGAAQPQQTYMSTAEPLNYRRLLDRNMSCNWRYIVDKIVCNNDQQASIFLQQKLKVATFEQKFDIVQAIIDQAYPLMVNRFGNFLVQRCFEHGTPEQVVSIAQAIRGNTLNLSMDAFGCHVVQKAFDCVPEEYKAIMVHELLRRIPETVIHRYACHVWQKLFELRWNGEPPQIMRYVNEALRGMWHEVALGETGSLVVQNIFENCLDEDKRPCINEVLASIDVVAHGQFGNWCIQHVCEHGSIPDRTRAVDHVLRYATEYSMDQFASKVVEKCLKIGGNDFLDRYLDRVCESRSERPRMPLIDIAGDQFGNYLIQYILTQSDPERREIVASHIRKHMVSLRGSKYGSRVAMLCTNPSIATRPGPAIGNGRERSQYGSRSNLRYDYFDGGFR